MWISPPTTLNRSMPPKETSGGGGVNGFLILLTNDAKTANICLGLSKCKGLRI